jgi:carboxyl-terminal processing protease
MRIRIPAGLFLFLFFLTSLPCALVPEASAQAITRIERDRARGMLRAVRAEIERRYYDRTLHGVNLAVRAAELDRRIQRASTYTEALELVAQLPTTLRDSHTFFVPPQVAVEVDYGWSMLMVGDSCFVRRVDEGSDAARQGVAPGDRVLAVNGDLVTRDHLWQILYIAHVLRPQRWLRVRLRSADGTVRDLRLNARVEPSYRALALTRMEAGGGIGALIRAAELPPEELEPRLADVGDVLVWSLPTFSVTPGAIDEARGRLRGRAGLVLDLRGNGGGPVEPLRAVLGMLYRDRVEIGTLVERSRERPLMADGTGAGAFAGPVVVLVDSRSSAASEVLARTLQLTGRGVVLGDRTAGGAMHSLQRQMTIGGSRGALYGVSVTDAALVMADGAALEKTGVTPDELILPTPAQLAAGEDPVMARAMARVSTPAGR